nr:transcription termination factor Rho [Agilicoccus flavus]
MRLAELQELAGGLGIDGTAKMRKGDLITAIKARQGSGSPAPAASRGVSSVAPTVAAAPASTGSDAGAARSGRGGRRAGAAAGAPSAEPAQAQAPAQAEVAPSRGEQGEQRPDRGEPRADRNGGDRGDTRGADHRGDRGSDNRADRGNDNRGDRGDNRGNDNRAERNDNRADRSNDNRGNDNRAERNDNRGDRGNDNRGTRHDDDSRDGNDRGDRRDRQRNNRAGNDDDERGGRRRNRQRNRDRKRRGNRGGEGYENEQTESITPDDVLVPVAGILDVLDNYAFVRTSGYLPGSNDVYVPLGIVKKHGLRKGDAVTGAVKALRDGEQLPPRQKFNALVRLDTINGTPADQSRPRVEFGKLTPLYPQQRLRLETESNILTTRIMDLVSPIGKGQRGLIVAPAKAGKTMVMQSLANAITTNNPEVHLMVVLVDERPEEVTDMQRAVKGEVISSTFDRPALDHTTVAELAIERAKRLVEMGHDVVVLLDSITKLGRAYNLAAPASGRILSGGVDSAALYPPKRFFGAARNIEHGGSLTILATALVETGSKMDEVIFEEFKGTGNMELKLDRQLANRRIFPAVDVNNSSTRREEILLSSEELKIMWKLRRVLAALDSQQGIELLIDRLKKTKNNVEFLMQVQSNSPLKGDDD